MRVARIDLQTLAALIAAAAAIGAALITGMLSLAGVWMSVLRHREERRSRQRERIRAAYVRWHSALDWLTELEQRVILLRQAAMEAQSNPLLLKDLGGEMKAASLAVARAQHDEVAAFARLTFLDFGSPELGRVDSIRKIAP